MGSITLVNSQAIGLAPWANSVLLHCPNHLPSSLATSLPKRRRSQFSNHRPAVTVFSGVGVTNSVPVPRSGTYTVGDFMTKKDDLQVVKPTTTVDEALEALVEKRITGFPVVDDHWKLVRIGLEAMGGLIWFWVVGAKFSGELVMGAGKMGFTMMNLMGLVGAG
uniref:CBS domain-containing protein n=1 Tax=Fagus sylvatica TaxID=28930 RepID=A0A2N9IF88_FAGSY